MGSTPFRGGNYHSSSLEYCVRCFCFCLPVYTFQSSRRFIDMIYLPSYNSGLHNERDVCKPCQSTQKEQTVFFTNIHVSVVHFLNLHLSESEQQQQDGDNSVVPCSGLPGQVRWLKESMGNKVSDCNTPSQLQKLWWPIRDKKLLF